MGHESGVMGRLGFDKTIGQELAKRVLSKAAREANPTHAYLFLGPEGTGKLTTAIEFAKALNCLSFDELRMTENSGNACGDCAICHSIEHGNLPDVRVWSPDGKNTKIEQMREMRDLAILRPMRARWKVNIVEQGDTMNEESANCILKLLEEPPDYLINILLFRNAAAALPTIRSRCQTVRFTQVSATELVDRLMDDYGVGNDEARFLAAYSQGCPGKAIRLIGDTEFFGRRDVIAGVAAEASSKGNRWKALRLAESLRASGSAAADDESADGDEPEPPAADKSKKARKGQRDATLEALDILLVWYRDLLATRLQGPDAALVNVDRADEVSAQSAAYAHAGRILSAADAISEARRAILGNGSPQIVTEALMMRLTA